jgi:hypothetical protein
MRSGGGAKESVHDQRRQPVGPANTVHHDHKPALGVGQNDTMRRLLWPSLYERPGLKIGLRESWLGSRQRDKNEDSEDEPHPAVHLSIQTS